MLAEVLHFKFLRLCERRNFFMDSAQSENRFETWIKGHLWLLAIIAGLLVFVSLAGPALTSKGVTATYDAAGDYWTFAKSSDRAEVWANQLFQAWPFIVCYVFVGLAVVLSFLGRKWNNCYIASLLLFVCAGIVFFTGTSLYDFALCAKAVGKSSGADYFKDYAYVASTKLSFGCDFAGVLCFIAAFFDLVAANAKDAFNVRDMAEIGILSAAAIGLQFIRIPLSGGAGSINLGLIPLFVIALRHGPTKGFIAGAFIYGFITCLTDGYGLFTYPLDYLVGFGSCAALGFFSKLVFTGDKKGWSALGFVWIAVGCVLATFIRFVGSSASSMVNYGYDFIPALQYNVIYIPVTGADSLAAMEMLYIPLARLNVFFPVKKATLRAE
jgi:thiamine transporter ThiT